MSVSSCAAECGRSAARSTTVLALNPDARREASLSVKVLWSWCGASSRTVLRCDFVMARTRSASDAIVGVSCRAAKLATSPPSVLTTRAASGCIGCATTARVPALDVLSSGTRRRAEYASASRSAIGERQMFPVQTNKTCRATLTSTVNPATTAETLRTVSGILVRHLSSASTSNSLITTRARVDICKRPATNAVGLTVAPGRAGCGCCERPLSVQPK